MLTTIISTALIGLGGAWAAYSKLAPGKSVVSLSTSSAKPGEPIDRATAFAYLDSLRAFFDASKNQPGADAIATAGRALFDQPSTKDASK